MGNERILLDLGDTFFLHSKGGRSIRDVVDQALTDLVGQAIFDSYELGTPLKSKIILDLSDSYAGKFMYVEKKPPARSVLLSVKLILTNGSEKKYEIDLANEAAEKRLSSIQNLRRTAFHEAGHAIANDPKLTGEVIDFVTIKSAGFYGGYARYTETEKAPYTRRAVIARIGRLLAGREGEIAMGFEASQGWQSDLESARELAQDAIVKYGLVEDPFSIPALGEKPDPNHPVIHSEITKILKEGQEYAQEKLIKNKKLFQAISAYLLRKSEMRREKNEKIIKENNCESLLLQTKS